MDIEKLPRWKSHKVVRAARIIETCTTTGPDAVRTLRLDGTNETYAAHVDNTVWARYIPAVGDYLVAYGDGYISFSPARAFEEGYARVDNVAPFNG